MKATGLRRLPQPILNTLLTRSALIQSMLDQAGRDLDADCGYPNEISLDKYTRMYKRDGGAQRVVRCLPEETWVVDPEVYETEEATQSPFEQAWEELVEEHNVYSALQRADELSGIGQFGILLFGFDGGEKLSDPVEGVTDTRTPTSKEATRRLLYLRAFDESCVTVAMREEDPSSPRYQRPTQYDLSFSDQSITTAGKTQIIHERVHWSRVLHLADNCIASNVYGEPRMKAVYNRLLDVRKLLGGSAEMFWKGAFPGYSFEVNPEIADQGIQIDGDSLKEQMQAYMDGLQRYLATEGLTTRLLAPQVVDPQNHVMIQLRMIALALGIPFRVLFGSELGELASSQDASNFAKRIMKRQNKYVTPNIIKPFAWRLIEAGVLPAPSTGKVLTDWPDMLMPSDMDKAEVASKRTQALATYVTGGVEAVIPVRDFLVQFMSVAPDEADALLESYAEQTDEFGQPPDITTDPNAVGTDPTGPNTPDAGIDATTVPFNGAQVTAATQIVKDVAAGLMPRESGIGQLVVFFKLSQQQAEQVIGTAGTKSFVPAPDPTETPANPPVTEVPTDGQTQTA